MSDDVNKDVQNAQESAKGMEEDGSQHIPIHISEIRRRKAEQVETKRHIQHSDIQEESILAKELKKTRMAICERLDVQLEMLARIADALEFLAESSSVEDDDYSD
jgi:hypothetical protein